MVKISENSQLLAVDPSLTASGWALFGSRDPQPLAVGIISPPGPKTPLADRLKILQEKLDFLFDQLKLSIGDVLVCEGPAPLIKNPQSALKVEHVRSIFETVARSHGLVVPGRINPRTVQVELLGMKGRQLARKEVKLWARETANRLYGSRLQEIFNAKSLPQDIIDAALIGSVAQVRLKLSLDSGINLIQTFTTQGKISTSRRSSWSSKNKSVSWGELEFSKFLSKR